MLQCEKAYELSLRRIGLHKHDLASYDASKDSQKSNTKQFTM